MIEQVLADLAAEGDALDALVQPLSAQEWRLPTPAQGWTIGDQIGHLAWTDHAALLAATDPTGWDALIVTALGDPDGFVDTTAHEYAADPDLVAGWRTGRAALAAVLRNHEGKITWFGPPMSPTSMATARFMETWAHGLDVAEALGQVSEPSDRIRHVAHLGVRTRDFAFGSHQLSPPAEEFRVALVAPSGEKWSWGPDQATQTVTGSAYDFCLLVTQRRHRDDLDLVATGAEAERWLDIAQAFAGPPGSGREPR